MLVNSLYSDVSRVELLPAGTYTAPATVEDCEDAWNEVAPTGCTITAGTANKVVGTNCVKIAMTASAAAGIIASEVVTLDLSAKKFLSLYIMCTKGVAAGDLQFCIDDTAECASPVKTLDIPALKANVMNWVVLDLGTAASGQDAIISVGLKMVTDLGACDIYVDHVESWADHPTTGVGIDMRDYIGIGKIVLTVAGVSAGTKKTLDVALQHSDSPYYGYAAFSPAKAFTQVTTTAGAEEKALDLDGCKRYVRAVATLGSTDCVYYASCHGYGIKQVRP